MKKDLEFNINNQVEENYNTGNVKSTINSETVGH